MTIATSAPNHHADYPGFAGPFGFLAGLSMSFGRAGDADLAERLTSTQPGDRVVDVGCGPGTGVRHAARLGATVTGVDPAPVMLRLARRLTRRRDRITLRQGAAEALPLPDGSATVLWSIATVHHWSDLDCALSEVGRVLESSGRFVAIERQSRPGATGHASHGWTDEQAEEFAQLCRTAGFDEVRVEHHTTRRRSVLAVIARNPQRSRSD
jgi:ubiquinone/menaquinone biosynthesis C-methylase UbiE